MKGKTVLLTDRTGRLGRGVTPDVIAQGAPTTKQVTWAGRSPNCPFAMLHSYRDPAE